jgi:predicted secreted protein
MSGDDDGTEMLLIETGIGPVIIGTSMRNCNALDGDDKVITIPSKPLYNKDVTEELDCSSLIGGYMAGKSATTLNQILVDIVKRMRTGTVDVTGIVFVNDKRYEDKCDNYNVIDGDDTIKVLEITDDLVSSMTTTYEPLLRAYVEQFLTGVTKSQMASGSDTDKQKLKDRASTIKAYDFTTVLKPAIENVLNAVLVSNALVGIPCSMGEQWESTDETDTSSVDKLNMALWWNLLFACVPIVLISQTPDVPQLLFNVAPAKQSTNGSGGGLDTWIIVAIVLFAVVGIVLGVYFGMKASRSKSS